MTAPAETGQTETGPIETRTGTCPQRPACSPQPGSRRDYDGPQRSWRRSSAGELPPPPIAQELLGFRDRGGRAGPGDLCPAGPGGAARATRSGWCTVVSSRPYSTR